MKVRMLVSIAGHAMPHYGITGTFSFAPGEVIDLHDELADKWIESGLAEASSNTSADFGNLQKKTKAQLLAFGKEQLHLELDPSLRKDAIISAICAKLEESLERSFAFAPDGDDGEDDGDGKEAKAGDAADAAGDEPKPEGDEASTSGNAESN